MKSLISVSLKTTEMITSKVVKVKTGHQYISGSFEMESSVNGVYGLYLCTILAGHP